MTGKFNDRRLLLRAAAAAAVLANPLMQALAADKQLPKTPRDYEGPYYPKGPRNPTNDLISGEPRSRVLSLSGEIVRTDGTPLQGAVFDFWQTDPLGRYKHPRDRTAGERWNDFLYWGEAQTDDNGRFALRTYVPGKYPPRPAHIHYKVWFEDAAILTSQMYFAELGGAQGASQNLLADERQTVHLLDSGENAVRTTLQVVV